MTDTDSLKEESKKPIKTEEYYEASIRCCNCGYTNIKLLIVCGQKIEDGTCPVCQCKTLTKYSR